MKCHSLNTPSDEISQIWVNISSGSGFISIRYQADTSASAELLWNEPLGTNLNETFVTILTLSFNKMHFKMLSAKCWPFCSCWPFYAGFNVLRTHFSCTLAQKSRCSDRNINTPSPHKHTLNHPRTHHHKHTLIHVYHQTQATQLCLLCSIHKDLGPIYVLCLICACMYVFVHYIMYLCINECICILLIHNVAFVHC